MVNNLEEFILRIEDFNNLQSSELIDYFIYYLQNFAGQSSVKAKEIENCFTFLTIPPYSNISSYLLKNSKKVKGKTQKFIGSNSSYQLTRQRTDEISSRIVLDIPKITIEKNLRNLLSKLTNASERAFLEEAIKTFEIEAYRASIIMVWLLTLDHLYEYILANKLSDFIAALRRMGNSKSIHSKDDFGDIKEVTFIEACRGAGIISNDIRKILDTKLGIRNSFAHPSTISLPKSKALEFIEDLVDNVILKY
jgi:hypothetical protein